MAVQTDPALRNLVIYSVFVRNHTKEGTFRALIGDLDRIRALGTDVIWLLPVYPIGEMKRKGTLGSPYAIRDYRAVDPALGSMDDFLALADAIHARGMRCVLDIVYNHTSPDSVLAAEHPEWFFRNPDGSFRTRIADWSDIIDLDYSKKDLWNYQIETLKQWAKYVDGFRCDVAPLVPLAFWLAARDAVEDVRPGCLWIAESVEPEFIMHNRAHGIPTLSDSELFQAFDISYEYDTYPHFARYLRGEISLSAYTDRICLQEAEYPENYVKLRFLENHDRARAASLIPDSLSLLNWTAFLYFQKGAALLYAGQENACTDAPTLFERDPVGWNTGTDLTQFLVRLASVKKDPLLAKSSYSVKPVRNSALLAEHIGAGRRQIGLFSLSGEPCTAFCGAPDGEYQNLAWENTVRILNGEILSDGRPVILEVPCRNAV